VLIFKDIRVLFVLAAMICWFGARAATAAELPTFPDADTEGCANPNETPECALKTFWMCNEENVAICKMVGIALQPDGEQKKDDGGYMADAWLRPWSTPWSQLLNLASPDYDVWEMRGIREVSHSRIRGLRRAPTPVIGAYEIMIHMVDTDGVTEKASVFVEERKGSWIVLAYARWRNEESIDPCDRKKLRALACRFSITGMRPW
jgi:hypothetical protein